MSTTTALVAGPSKNVAVTVIGLITMLWGGVHAALGSGLILVGASLQRNLRPDDPAGGFAPILWILEGLAIFLGVLFLLQGVLGMLAALGVLLHKQWGRILTFIMAGLAILWGLLSLSAYNSDATGNATLIAYGAFQLLYAILTFVILIKNGAEFSRPRV
jgi:hypothetical protein